MWSDSQCLCAEAVLSDSEEDRHQKVAVQRKTTSAWSSERTPSSEKEGYSSEASSDRGEDQELNRDWWNHISF